MANTRKLTERQEAIDCYLQACVNLYGHITPRQFLLIFNKYNEKKLLKDELMRSSVKLNGQAANYRVYSNAVINTTVEPHIIDKIIYYQQGKKYYVPMKEELLRWRDPGYCREFEQGERLREMLLSKFHVSPLAIGSLYRELYRSVLTEDPMQTQSDILDKYHVFDKSKPKEFNEFFCGTFMEFVNNLPRWANCGYTPKEMRRFL